MLSKKSWQQKLHFLISRITLTAVENGSVRESKIWNIKLVFCVCLTKHQSLYFWGENWKRATNFTMFNLVLASYTLQYKEVNQVNYLSSWTKYLDHQQRAKFAGWIFLLFRLYNHKLECQSNAEITWFSSQWPCYLLYSTKRGPVKWRSEQVK